MRSSVFALLTCLSVAACSSTSTSPAGSGGGTAGADGGADEDAGLADLDAGSTASGTMNGCSTAKYLDVTTGTANDRMIMISGGKFDYPCMTILKGQSVMFMWDLATYPLEPGVSPSHPTDPAGTTPSPITEKTSGSIATIKFPTAGMYPYYVKGHTTMSGVVEVK
jgi:plastocyanin